MKTAEKFKGRIDICKESGEVIKSYNYLTELGAQADMDALFSGKKSFPEIKETTRISEFYTGGTVGFVKLYAFCNKNRINYLRREFCINV